MFVRLMSRVNCPLNNLLFIFCVGVLVMEISRQFWVLEILDKLTFMVSELLFISKPASLHIYLKGIGTSCKSIDLIHLVQLVLREVVRV